MSDFRSRLAVALAGRYTLERELGRGGMSIVYLAHDPRHDRQVALKVLRPELAATLGPVRFLREIKLAAGLAHPHILPLHDSGEADGCLYYVMPYVAGESLRQRLDREGPLPLEDAIGIAREVADALDYAHQHDVVHRDIKPENILLQAGHAVVSDFGIARAISAAGGGRVTGTGLVVGTPDYMSPEQAGGREEVDGRSDIYSLGCVVYEMLVGRPPYPADSPGERPPAVSAVRPAVPLEVVLAIEEALARRPEERFQRAADFARALGGSEPGVATISGERRRRRARRRWAGIAAAGAAGALVTWRLLAGTGAAVDPARFVVLPFTHTRGAEPALIDGDLCARLLYQGFAQWADVSLTDPLRVSDALQRLDGSAASGGVDIETGLAVARRLGAGRLVRGELWQFRDTTFVMAAIYDVTRGGRQVKSHVARLVPGASEAGVLYGLADSLLFAGTRTPPGPHAVRPTTSIRALLAHEEGHKALDLWDLTGAAAGFRRAAAYDTSFAHALFELAQVKAWQGLPPEAWRDTAGRAARLADRLVPRERLLAQALEAMGAGRHEEACLRYRAQLARDSLDATAWYGLGDCQAKDRVVVRDPRSPSGWRFRSSYHAATLAYRRALDLAPSLNLLFRGQVYAHLARLLYTEPHHLRSGRPLPPDTGLFAAFAGFSGDTLAFVPYPVQRVMAGEVAPTNPAEAMVHARDVLGQIVTAWLAAFPASAEAHATAAAWLEGQGRLGGAGGERSALAEIRAAGRLAQDSAPGTRVELGSSEVRILVKLRDFAGARRVADSVMAATAAADPLAAEVLAGLATLTGRSERAADLLRQAAPRLDSLALSLAPRPFGAPQPVLEGAGRFLAYAAVGGPADSLRAQARRSDSLLGAWLPPARQTTARTLLLGSALALAFSSIGPSALHRGGSPHPIIDLQTLLARGDTAALRQALAQARARSAPMRLGQVAVDAVYLEALLFLAVRDTVAAREHLDDWLGGLALARQSLVGQPAQAGSLVRAMALRAELADRAGDRAAARQWAQAVVALWSDADPGLQPVVRRMRRL